MIPAAHAARSLFAPGKVEASTTHAAGICYPPPYKCSPGCSWVTSWEGFTAGLPFIIVNTLCGALAAYGFAGLRYTPAAILLYSAILVLQSLIAIQVMVFCVYVSATQVSPFPACILRS